MDEIGSKYTCNYQADIPKDVQIDLDFTHQNLSDRRQSENILISPRFKLARPSCDNQEESSTKANTISFKN
jgi:hypothetical protein